LIVKKIKGLGSPGTFPSRKKVNHRQMMPSHTELIINRLRQDGIHIEKRLTHFDWSIDLDEKEYTWAQKCFNSLDIPRGHVPIAVGIGGDRAIVRWSYDTFKELLLLLKVIPNKEYPRKIWLDVFSSPRNR
jgi:hypothetical protein